MSELPPGTSVDSPLVTLAVHEALLAASRTGHDNIMSSLDLGRSSEPVRLEPGGWHWRGRLFPYLTICKERTIYHWNASDFAPVARFGTALVKLVPTQWGAPTFEIDGIKMLVSEHVSPFADAQQKVMLIRPKGKVVLDTCGGLGYFAAWCLQLRATRVLSFERSPEVLWLRSLNPWSPAPDARLALTHGDVLEHCAGLPDASVDAVLHDPPRFGIAGELYSLAFYQQLARVLRPNGMLFHYVGTPNQLTSGRNVPREVLQRLEHAGLRARPSGDGVLAVKSRGRGRR